MTADDWKKLPPGTAVRWWPGGKRAATPTGGGPIYFETKVKRRPYHLGTGRLVVPLDGLTEAKPVEELEVVPKPVAACAPGPVHTCDPYAFDGP